MAGAFHEPVVAMTHVRSHVGHYRIIEQLGEGGMGVVLLARDESLGRNVALKLLAPRYADNVEFRERFIRESRLAAAIEHPNIIPVYEAGNSDGRLFIAMRYVRGVDLHQLLAIDGALKPDRALALMDQLARALDAAHRAGLVHRDVKPGNVMLDLSEGREHCYLTDFGLTKDMSASSGQTATGAFVGTLHYMAPEQIEGRRLDARADQYALGCVVFECLTGQPPFQRDSDIALMYAHLHEPPPSVRAARPELRPAVDMVLSRAMAKASGDRYESCADLVEALRPALAGADVPSCAPSAASTGRRFSRPILHAPPAEPSPPASQPPTGAEPAEPVAPASIPPAPSPPPSAPRASVGKPPTRPARAAPPRSPRPRRTVREIPSTPPPAQAGRDRTHMRAASIVAVAILLCAGGIAAALLLKNSDSAGDSAAQLAHQRLLDRTVRLNKELITLEMRLERTRGRPDAATRSRLAADQREANELVARSRAQQAGSPAGPSALLGATQKLAIVTRGLLKYARTRQPVVIVNVKNDLTDAGTRVQAAQSEPPLPSAPVTTGAALATRPMTRVSLPADALGMIVPRAGETISSVDQIGDLNGDSKPDLGVVARSANGSGSTGYVVFAGNAGDVDLGRLASQGRGFEIPGAMSIAAAGDVNGNGHPDLAVIGATAGGAVAAFVLFDPAAAGQIDLQNLGGAGREIDMPTANEAPDGPQDGIANYVIRAAGDVNHDGVDDVIVGDPFADGAAGRAWVVFGSPDQVPTVALDALAPSEGFSITGSGTGSLGESVAAVGDVNGDGIDDVAVGAPYRSDGIAQLGSGVVDVIYGSDKPTNVDDPQLNGARGFQITNPAQTGQLGAAIAPLGDVNGDSVPDVLVTAPGMSPNGRTQAGSAYVVFGPGKPISGLSLDKLGSHGYEIQGPSPAKHGPGSILSGLGSSAAPAGDVNGDSVPDIVLGSPGAAAPGAVAYVVFGGPDHSTLDLADPGGRARAIDGPTASPPAPLAVTGAFDMDGDGRPDVLVAPGGAAAGPTAAYAVSGAP